MKKFLSGLLIGFMLTFAFTAYAATDIRLVINGQDITDTMDIKPQNISGRIMVPAKYVAESLGASVSWDAATSTMTISSAAQEQVPANTKGTVSGTTQPASQTAGQAAAPAANSDKLTVKAGGIATLSYTGEPNTEYKISVYYSSGVSKAAGLVAKTSNASGDVSWTWKVGTNTKPGEYRVAITGGNKTTEKLLIVQ